MESEELPAPYSMRMTHRDVKNDPAEAYMKVFNRLVYDSWGGRPRNRIFDHAELPKPKSKQDNDVLGMRVPTGVRLKLDMERMHGDSIKCENAEDMRRFNSLVEDIYKEDTLGGKKGKWRTSPGRKERMFLPDDGSGVMGVPGAFKKAIGGGKKNTKATGKEEEPEEDDDGEDRRDVI